MKRKNSKIIRLFAGLSVLFSFFVLSLYPKRSVFASSINNVTVDASNFQDYFSWNANHSSNWSTAVTTNGTAQTGGYDYNATTGLGTATLTTATGNQSGIVALTALQMDMTQPIRLSLGLNMGKLGGADGVSLGFYPGNAGKTGAGGADSGIGGLRGAFGWTVDPWANSYTIPSNLPATGTTSTSADPAYTLGDGISSSNDNKLYGGDPSTLKTGSTAIGGWTFANPNPMYDAPNSTMSGNNGIIAPKTAYNRTDSPQQTISELADGTFRPLTLTYTPGTGSTPANEGTLEVSYGGGTSTSKSTAVVYSSTNPSVSGVTAITASGFSAGTNKTVNFTYTSPSGNSTTTGSYTQGTATVNRVKNTTVYRIEIGTVTTITQTPYDWSIPITTLEDLAGVSTTDSSGNKTYPTSLSFFMTGSTGGAVNLQQVQIPKDSFVNFEAVRNTVTTNYIDANGNPIAPKVTTSGVVGSDTYITNPLSTVPTGYSYVGLATAKNNSAKIVSDPATGLYQTNNLNVYYVYKIKPETATVTYVDDSIDPTGQNPASVLQQDTITGDFGSQATYSTASVIANLESKGYYTISDGFTAANTASAVFSQDGVGQNFIVHMTKTTYTATSLTKSTETINFVDGSGNPLPWYAGVDGLPVHDAALANAANGTLRTEPWTWHVAVLTVVKVDNQVPQPFYYFSQTYNSTTMPEFDANGVPEGNWERRDTMPSSNSLFYAPYIAGYKWTKTKLDTPDLADAPIVNTDFDQPIQPFQLQAVNSPENLEYTMVYNGDFSFSNRQEKTVTETINYLDSTSKKALAGAIKQTRTITFETVKDAAGNSTVYYFKGDSEPTADSHPFNSDGSSNSDWAVWTSGVLSFGQKSHPSSLAYDVVGADGTNGTQPYLTADKTAVTAQAIDENVDDVEINVYLAYEGANLQMPHAGGAGSGLVLSIVGISLLIFLTLRLKLIKR
ncbi:mucin-binding protein [Lactococcus kimchii]|uniref:mucin-binding protein n=1 Tax=Lactococcus sp. S-13 TaxID=2507158 RepID=UPI001022AF72|nr:MucBP domain-containing protein [Lactococcus sp. S-13]RZI48583.1 hypothetical protein EQJ87_03435 [Lactococcus sp. S-13]